MTDLITIDRAVVEQALEALVWEAGPEPALYAAQTDKAITALRAALAQAEPVEPVACSDTFGCRCPKHFAAQQAEPVAWLRVIDEAMVVHHLGIADPTDDYETAKRKMNTLLCMAQDIGADFAKQAEPAQEPVAWRVRRRSEKFWNVSQHKPLDAMQDDRFEVRALVDAVDQQQAEPVQPAAGVDAYDMIDRFLRNNLRDDDYAEYSAALDSLYTAPPQRKPLTEEEKRALADKFLSCQPESYEVSGVFDLISAVERAHGIGKESGDER